MHSEELVGEELIVELKKQIQFLVSTFSQRDAEQQAVIKHLEGIVAMQSNKLAWFQGAHAPEQPAGVTQ